MSHDVIIVSSPSLYTVPFLYLGHSFDDAIQEYVCRLPRPSILLPGASSPEYIIYRNKTQINNETALATYILQEKHSKELYEINCEYFDEHDFITEDK